MEWRLKRKRIVNIWSLTTVVPFLNAFFLKKTPLVLANGKPFASVGSTMNVSNALPEYREWLNLGSPDPLKVPLSIGNRCTPLAEDGTTDVWFPRLYNAAKAYADFIYNTSSGFSDRAAFCNGFENKDDWDREITVVHNALNNPPQFALLKCFHEEGIVRKAGKVERRYHGGGWVSRWQVGCWLVLDGGDNPREDLASLKRSGFFPIPLTAEGKVPSELFLCMALRFFYMNNVLRYSQLNTHFQQFLFLKVCCFFIWENQKPPNDSRLTKDYEEVRQIMCEKQFAPVDFCYLKSRFMDEAKQLSGAQFVSPSLLDDVGWLQQPDDKKHPLPTRFEHMGPYMSGFCEPSIELKTCALLLGTFIGHPLHSGPVFLVQGLEPADHLDWQSCFLNEIDNMEGYEEVECGLRQESPQYVKVTQRDVDCQLMRRRQAPRARRYSEDYNLGYLDGKSDGIMEMRKQAYFFGGLLPVRTSR